MGGVVVVLAALLVMQTTWQEGAMMPSLATEAERQAELRQLEEGIAREQEAEMDAREQLFREIDEAQAIVKSTCLLGDSEAHVVLVAKGVSDNLQDSLFLLDEWCYTKHAPTP